MKGIFYSTITLLFIAPLILVVLTNINSEQTSLGLSTSKITGDKLAAYSRSIQDDMPRALDIMTKRAVSDALIYVENSGSPLTDSSSALTELITNGTIYGNTTSVDFTITSWANMIQDKGKHYGFNTKVSLVGVRFWSEDSYTVGVEMSMTVNATNPVAGMELYRTYNATALLPIEGLDDPLYTLKTNGILKRQIKTPTMTLSGMPNFDAAVTNGFYMQSAAGPGFLDRLEGRLTQSGKYGSSGLESVVFLPDFQANGLPADQSRTDIDYLYFNSYPGSSVSSSSYGWLRIDTEHASTYNITII